MYPKNAASPQRIAVGAVVQISDGAVQTSGVSVKVMPQGGAASAGGGTTGYEEGIVHYIPTQAETNYASFQVIAYKTGCIPAAVTIVTSASGTAGYAGLDWSAINAPTTTVVLSGTTVKTATDVETKVDTVDTVVDAIKVKTDFLPSATAGAAGGVFIAGSNAATSITTALTANITGNVTGNLSGSVGSVTGAVGSVTGAVGSVTGAVGSVTGNVGGNVVGSVASVVARVTANTDQLAGQTVTAAAGVTFPTSVASPTNITAATGIVLSGVTHTGAVIPTVTTLTGHTPQTGDSFARIGAAGASLTALPWNAAWDAEVQSEVQDAIEVNHLDHLLAVTYDPGTKPGAADALLNELVESDAGVARFTANALEQGPSGGGGVADWTADERTAIRSILGIPASGTTPDDPTTGILDTIRDAVVVVDTVVDAILVDTAEIGAAGAGLTALATAAALTTVDDFLDTEIAAIKAKTDLIPAAPAAVGDIPTAAAIRAEMDLNSTKLASIETRGDRVVLRGTVSATSPTTTSFTASVLDPSGSVADQFKGRIIVFDKATTTAALRGQATDITANTGAALPVFTFTALTTAPASGDTFSIT